MENDNTGNTADDFEIQQKKIDELLIEFASHRDAIKDMIKDLEKIREKVDKLIPENLDNRFIRFFEEKVKSITGLFNSLLEMRKEIAKSAKDEIEIRRKMKDKSGSLENIEEILDIRSVLRKVDKFKEETTKMKEDRFSKGQVNYDPTIIIPGINDENTKETTLNE